MNNKAGCLVGRKYLFILLFLFSNTAFSVDFWFFSPGSGQEIYGTSSTEVAEEYCATLIGVNTMVELSDASNPNVHLFLCYFETSTGFAFLTSFFVGKRSCPAPQNADAPFDSFDFDLGLCQCSNSDYEPRNSPLATPPQVGCFLIEDEDIPDKDDGCGDNNTDNPCNVATGNKYKSQTDVSGGLSFTRSYNSRNLVDLGLGKGWRSGYQKRLIVSGDSLTLASGTGRGEPWSKTGSTWSGDADSDFIITEDASGLTITKQNGDIEAYNTSGQLLSETDSQGKQTTYVYDANSQLTTVTNHYGETLSFTYDANGHLQTVTDAVGAVYTYEYDANDNLVTVIYPDITPSDNSDNPRKIYHYENVDYPNHLTGITDENGDRYQSYAYDASGKAIQSEKASTSSAVGQERIQLDFQE